MQLHHNIERLRRAGKAAGMAAPAAPSRLQKLPARFANPGALRAFCHVPEGLQPGAGLVVVLHGCTQTAAGYDQGSGWSQLADRRGFAVLFPEQTNANNQNLCFNWFQDGDARRGGGEAASIAAMTQAMCKQYGLDPARVFVTGLSAGGAMTSVMLAAYPDLFAGGAIIAGMPYGCASSVAEAFACMGGRSQVDAAALPDKVRRAAGHKGPWPRVSVWHGGADHIVVPGNADAIVAQWAPLHELSMKPSRTGRVEGYPHHQWLGPAGEIVIERYDITGMAHGTPLMPGTDDGQSGVAGAHMLDAGISSTDRIAAFFGVAPEPKGAAAPRPSVKPRSTVAAASAAPKRAQRLSPELPEPANEVQAVIEKALRSAGLMR